jgi:hypothetical protein
MTDAIDYEAVLADLRARRERLDALIEGVELLVASGGLGAIEGGPARGTGPREVADDSFLGMNIPAAARKYLQMMKRPQATSDIAAALRRGGVHSGAKDFNTTVYTALSRQKDVVRVGTKWSLREWHPNLRSRPKGETGDAGKPDADDASSPEE